MVFYLAVQSSRHARVAPNSPAVASPQYLGLQLHFLLHSDRYCCRRYPSCGVLL